MRRLIFGRHTMRILLLTVSLWHAVTAFADQDYRVTTLVNQLHSPWTLVQLPDKRWVITELKGNLVFVEPGEPMMRKPLQLPDLYVAGQGGLLDIALAQDFALSQRVLLTFSQGDEDNNHLAVASAKLEGEELVDLKVLLKVAPDKDTPVHFGGRLLALPDGTWLVTTGDGFDYREHAQVMHSQLGKILRFREDGTAPQDNPFADAPYTYTLGHRNPQGLIRDPKSGQVISHEHGPDGGDEINIIRKGENYGWPVITQGLDYSGAKVTPYTKYPGMEQPFVDWTPSIAPSSMVLYTDSAFKDLQNRLLITTLKSKALYAVDWQADSPRTERIFASIEQRLRDIAVDDNGALMVLTDGSNAQLLKIEPE